MSKHVGFGPLLEVEMLNKCTPLWREAHVEVNMYKHTILGALLEVAISKKCMSLRREANSEVKMYETHHSGTTFGSSDVEKVHAVLARSTFGSENVKDTTCSDRFWTSRCRSAVEKVHAVVARSAFESKKC